MGGTSSTAHALLTSLADPCLAEEQVLLQLLDAISPGCVRPCYVLPGHTKADKESNAKYAVSVARKVGCFVFLSAEDVVSGKPALMLMLLAALMARDRALQAAKERAVLVGTGIAGEEAVSS
ncbi:calponin homology domain-containing protein [Dunaliella salina]|uniref:Calponin homology domain-containing protein n=1 Tax=Dunaliella salina TaxID=3046 RepID=A0ABQ7GC31_DUNSA|nr:calponin homology domain-containing protein [Dunaliella salina]|eukprot:KAF5832159.1 calponin homology domain-containing protein [Dunaliella salina]